MAKKARKPEPPEVTRKQASLSKRERSAQRNVLIFAGVVGVATLFVFGFGLVRTGSLFADQIAVATVNDEKITVAEMRKRVRLGYFSSTQNQPAQQTGQPQEIDVATLADAVLDDMITEVLVREAAAEMGITVSESEIDDAIRMTLGFRPVDTTSSSIPTPFPTVPPTTPTATSTFVFTPTPSPTIEGVADGATPTPTVTPTEVAQEASEGEASPTPTATPTQGPPTEEEEAAFRREYEAFLDIWTGAADMTEAEIRDLFAYSVILDKLFEEVDLDIPAEAEQALVGHILVETEEEAEALLEELEGGGAFSEVAAENSTDAFSAYRGGELGWFSGEQIGQFFSEDFADFVLNQPLGEPGGPVETPLGYHIVLVYDRQMVPLTEMEYLVRRQQEFATYIDALRTDAEENIEIEENWQRYLPPLS
jgi:parvulin-like peptidyl-prolyl isomerase